MRAAFLPHNYMHTLYQQLHNLRQGTQFIDEYTQEFYQLDLVDSKDQLFHVILGACGNNFKIL